jgi:hypothetical protein
LWARMKQKTDNGGPIILYQGTIFVSLTIA